MKTHSKFLHKNVYLNYTDVISNIGQVHIHSVYFNLNVLYISISVRLVISLPISLPSMHIYIYSFTNIFTYLSISITIFPHLCVCLSVYQYLHLSIYLSFFLPFSCFYVAVSYLFQRVKCVQKIKSGSNTKLGDKFLSLVN